MHYASAIASSGRITLDCLPAALLDHRGEAGASVEADLNLREKMERNLIANTLRATANNKSETAKRLGMSRKTLYDKLRRYDIAAS